MSFKFAITKHATEKDDFQQVEADPDDFIRNMIATGHKVGEKDGPGIVAATFEAGGRIEGQYVETITGIILDVDGKRRANGEVIQEVIDPDKFIAKLPWRGIAHSSYNHSPSLPKFRVILPLRDALSKDDHFRLWHWMNRITEGKIDQMCKNPDRMFYLPRTSKDALAAKYPWMKELQGSLLSMDIVPADFQPEESFNYERPNHRKQGLHKAPPETYRVNYDTARIFEAFMESKLVQWAMENPSAVGREAWRGIATNLAAVVVEHPDTQEEACKLFHEISEPDPARYNRSITQKTFLDAIKSAKTYGPMRYVKLIEAGAPENCWEDRRHSVPIQHARSKARVFDAVPQPLPAPAPQPITAPTVKASQTTVTVEAPAAKPAAALAKPNTKAVTAPSKKVDRPGFVDADETTDDADVPSNFVDVPTANASDLVYIVEDDKFRYKLPQKVWSEPITHSAVGMLLLKGGVMPKEQPLFKAGIKHCLKTAFVYNSQDAIVDLPEGYSVFNAYKATKLVPQEGDWGTIRQLVMNLVKQDEKAYEFVLDWLAKPVQNLMGANGPKLPLQMGSALVFMGDPGSGKGTLTLIMQLIYGEENVAVLSQDALDSRFTSDLKDKLFVVANEVMSSSNRSLETANKLKPWITDPTIVVEQKNKDREVIKNNCNVIFTSNDERPVLIDKNDRRFSVFHSKVLSRDISNKIYLDIAKEKLEVRAFFHHLLTRDVKIEFGELFKTQERKDIIHASMGSESRFMMEIIDEGWKSVGAAWQAAGNQNNPRELVAHGTTDVPSSTFREVYVDWCRRNGQFVRNVNQMSAALKELLPDVKNERIMLNGSRIRAWQGVPMEAKNHVEPVIETKRPDPVKPASDNGDLG